jgi:hypothetical protein
MLAEEGGNVMALKNLPDVFDFTEFEDPSQRHVCLELYYRADRRGVIRATQTEIAADCRLSRSTVAKTLARLLELGLLDYLGHGRYGLPRRENTSKPSPNGPPNKEALTTGEGVLAHIRQEWDGQPKTIAVLDEDPMPEWLRAGKTTKVLAYVGPCEIKGEPAWAYEVHWPPSS